MPDGKDLQEYPEFFKLDKKEPNLFPPTFDTSDEALEKMREQKETGLLFAALFSRIKDAIYEKNVNMLEKEFQATIELLEQESDNLYEDLNFYRKELESYANYSKNLGNGLSEDIEKAIEKHILDIKEKREKVQPPDEFQEDLKMIDLKGDSLIALNNLQELLKKYEGLMKEHSHSMNELYYRIRCNIILNTIGDVYSKLAQETTSEEEAEKYKKEAEEYHNSGLI